MSNQSAGAAWKKVINTKNGEVEVLSITIGDKRYTAWPNTFKKEGERSPDYRLNEDTYTPKEAPKAPKPKGFAGQDDLPF